MTRPAPIHPAGSPDVADALARFSHELVSHGKEAAAILPVAEAAPDHTLVQACAAALFLCLQTAEGPRRAAPWMRRALDAAGRPGVAEPARLFTAAIAAWFDGDMDRAIDRHRALAALSPHDLLNAKLAQIHLFNRGDRPGMLDLAQAVARANPGSGHALGMLAFALDQTGDPRAALRTGERAVARVADDAWAHHAVAHALESQGRVADGIGWLRAQGPYWDRCSSFMYTHNWWHLAVFHLEREEAGEALALFDTRIWGVRKTYVQDQVNAASLLARLELCGVDVGDRWTDVGAHVRPRLADQVNGFLDLHFMLALARSGDGDGVALLLDNAERHARTAPDGARWRGIALPALRAVAAWARGEPARAADLLEPVLPRLHLLGGSTAQLDLFDRMLLDSRMRAGRRAEAGPWLCRRHHRDTANPVLEGVA